ncbi:Sjogren's syndrome/scleroderma autoantigen 1 family protein [Halorubrum sp. BV1]|uniref:Sjogren's syndrome/scleroderma autoantigen 1 family protein n=1 Tax=Halorubrum sp. BV1 TaxID=1498500 RepID=UPI0006796353|nr:Sjogren's syndrome/scleroderma autoantigen 1 family protein [Halorubrum sp. BV1]
MSDGFDKEAEREKLREKFAGDDEKREHTQRMSELLLQGATMTNRHCDDCGDPIFRHDGREFCPTCQAGDSGDTEKTAGTTADTVGSSSPETAEAESAGTLRADTAETTPEPPASTAADPASTAADPASTAADPASTAADPASVGGDATTPPTDGERQARASGTAGSTRRGGERHVASDPAGAASVGDARDSLAKTLLRFARNAEATDDPRRAREHLRAAREAAETLETLD